MYNTSHSYVKISAYDFETCESSELLQNRFAIHASCYY